MSTTDDIFNGDENTGSDANDDSNQNTQGTPAPSSDDMWADKLKEIRNENGEPKYKSVEDALKALTHSQQFIDTLKTEKKSTDEKLAELQAELEKRGSVEDVVNRLLESKGQAQPADPPKTEASLDEKKVMDLVNQALQQQASKATAEQNVTKVSSALSEKFGDKASQVLKDRAKQVGTTPQALKELAQTNPNLVLELFAGVESTNTQSNTPSYHTPRTPREQVLDRPEKSLMQGSTDAEVKDYMKKIREDVYKRMGVTE